MLRVFPCLQGSARPLDRRFLFLPVLRRHTGRTESSAPTAFLRREVLSLRGAQRRGNPFSARRRRADGTSGTPSPTLIHSPIHHRGLFQFSVPSFRSNSAWMRRRSTACSGAVRRGSAAIRVWAASRQRGAAALTGRRGRRPLRSSIPLYTTEAYFSSACPRSGRTAPGCGGAARRAPALSGGDRRPSGSGRRPAPRQEAAYRS